MDPKVVGAPRVCRGTAGPEASAEARTLPAPVARSFPRLRPVRELRLGIRGWERSAHFAGANPLPRFSYNPRAAPTRFFSLFEAARRTGRDGA